MDDGANRRPCRHLEFDERGVSPLSIDRQHVHRIRRGLKPTLDDWPRGLLFLDKLIKRTHLDVRLTYQASAARVERSEIRVCCKPLLGGGWSARGQRPACA